MYLRWQSRVRKRNHDFMLYGEPGDVTWSAILVESTRVDDKPRQKHIAYLGSFSESQIAASPSQRVWIWDGMTKQLDRLDNRITRKDRKNIEASRITRPMVSPRETAHGLCKAACRRLSEAGARPTDSCPIRS